MKKLLCIILSAVMLVSVLATVSFAATADIVHQSVQGTAVLDGVKDDAYAGALALPMIQKGLANGAGKVLETPMATVYILNDAEWVYVFFEVTDDQIDTSNSNNWEQDSVEIYYMEGNVGKQVRFLMDGTSICNFDHSAQAVIVTTETGYNAEVKFPVTDVLNNQVETCVQINQCTDGIRDFTLFIEGHRTGDEAWQHTARGDEYDSWWTLTLAGESADTRVEEARDPMTIDKTTYAKLQNVTVGAYLSTQNRVDYSDYQIIGEAVRAHVGETVEFSWTGLSGLMNYTAETTENFTTMPFFNVVLGDGYMEADTEAQYHLSYSDITIKSEGYEDVVIPGSEINKVFKPKHNGQYVDGNTTSLDLATLIAAELDLSIEDTCTYLTKVTDVTGSVSLLVYEGRTKEELDTFLASIADEDTAVVTEIEPVGTKLADVEALFASEATFEEKETAYNELKAAFDEAAVKAENLPNAGALITEWTARVDALTLALEEARPAVTEPPVTEPPVTEAPETEAPETEAPEDSKPADTEPDGEGVSVVLIVVIALAVVAVAVVAVILIFKKKK